MTITFKPLHESHFPLLLKWLESPHIKKWWPGDRSLLSTEASAQVDSVGGDQDVTYTIELVREKYSSPVSSLRGIADDEAIQKNNAGLQFLAMT